MRLSAPLLAQVCMSCSQAEIDLGSLFLLRKSPILTAFQDRFGKICKRGGKFCQFCIWNHQKFPRQSIDTKEQNNWRERAFCVKESKSKLKSWKHHPSLLPHRSHQGQTKHQTRHEKKKSATPWVFFQVKQFFLFQFWCSVWTLSLFLIHILVPKCTKFVSTSNLTAAPNKVSSWFIFYQYNEEAHEEHRKVKFFLILNLEGQHIVWKCNIIFRFNTMKLS